jgi:hypothetical protein
MACEQREWFIRNNLGLIKVVRRKFINTRTQEYSLSGQVLSLLSRSYDFEFHKSQGHWRLTWSLISGPVRLVKCINWSKHSR